MTKLDEDGYKDAWKAFLNCYENKRRLKNVYFHDISTIKPMKSETISALSKLEHLINVSYEVLEWLGSASWDNLIVYLMASNFDENTQKDWL